METNVEQQVDAKAYAAFIKQIELEDIWLELATIENRYGPIMPEPGRVSIAEQESRWEPAENGFRAFHGYVVRLLSDDDQVHTVVSAMYGLEFSSKEEMTDEYFTTFAKVNLPINTWPFLREFFHSALGRMGWVPLALPTIKVGTPPEPSPPQEDSPPATGRRKRASNTTQSRQAARSSST